MIGAAVVEVGRSVEYGLPVLGVGLAAVYLVVVTAVLRHRGRVVAGSGMEDQQERRSGATARSGARRPRRLPTPTELYVTSALVFLLSLPMAEMNARTAALAAGRGVEAWWWVFYLGAAAVAAVLTVAAFAAAAWAATQRCQGLGPRRLAWTVAVAGIPLSVALWVLSAAATGLVLVPFSGPYVPLILPWTLAWIPAFTLRHVGRQVEPDASDRVAAGEEG